MLVLCSSKLQQIIDREIGKFNSINGLIPYNNVSNRDNLKNVEVLKTSSIAVPREKLELNIPGCCGREGEGLKRKRVQELPTVWESVLSGIIQ